MWGGAGWSGLGWRVLGDVQGCGLEPKVSEARESAFMFDLRNGGHHCTWMFVIICEARTYNILSWKNPHRSFDWQWNSSQIKVYLKPRHKSHYCLVIKEDLQFDGSKTPLHKPVQIP